jgi:curved DNA-binding protein CbpA
MKNIRTHYDNLKVARNAPPEVIRAAYKTLSQKHHPDRNGNSAESQRVMKIINESYAVLSDPEARRRHDSWILEQESPGTYEGKPQRPQHEVEFPPPVSGEVNFYDLDEETRKRIKDRASGLNKDQFRIKLDGVFWNYIWCVLLSGWFYYIYTSAAEYRWEEETTYWHVGFTAAVGFLLARNISWLYSWHSKPLKSWLVVTPLYLIKFHLDQISYWPIWTISDIKATHNYRNGSYQDTALSLTLDGNRKTFSISPKSAYQNLLNKLQEYDARFRSAVKSNDVAYIIDNDDFLPVREGCAKEKKKRSFSAIATYILIPLISFGFLGINYELNQERPFKPAYSKSKTPYNNKPQGKPSYVRPATAPNGASWPSHASYVADYPKLNTSGLSSVTVDNTQNDSDVFVKLASISANESHPVRVFFIPAFGKFKIDSINPGLYDIRYRDLTTGGLARSESFTLDEVSTYNGTRYSDMTMTLYKVRNGNMQTYGLSESEF